MVATLNEAVSQMCKSLPQGRNGMAAALGMTIDQFNNRLHRKCNSLFFTVDDLMRMEEISGTSFLAEFFANRHGLTLVDVSAVNDVDKVELFDIEMRANAAAGELAIAKQMAAEDGVIDQKELKTLSRLFQTKVRHQIQGFLGFLALYGVGVSDHSVDLFMASRKAEVAGVQLEATEV